MTSKVEELAIKHSKQKLIYRPSEKIGIIMVNSIPALGRLTALRFIEWVQNIPKGVIALPTGKTPEYFIKEVNRFLHGWHRKDIQKELDEGGVEPSKKPELKGLHFVQIDEFYPANPLHQNSFYYYVNKFYLGGLGLEPERALLIDCSRIGLPSNKNLGHIWPDDEVDLSLRNLTGNTKLERMQKSVIECIDQWCTEYEGRIRKLGGIGFFLGGIGPDGHIGFNVRGSDLYSTTRLTSINYETQAAAATDLGGIEVAKKRLVITIGLATITYNPDCTAIVMAAGEAKAQIVAESIQSERHVHYPATVLQKLPNARFYLTRGAAKFLTSRQNEALTQSESVTPEQIEKAVIDLALEKHKKIETLTYEDFTSNTAARIILKKCSEKVEVVTRKTAKRLKAKIEAGTEILKGSVFLHTEPHHDDLMLGYLPFIVRHIREHSNRHYFATLTSGFTSVTNIFMLMQLKKLKIYIDTDDFVKLLGEGYFDPCNRVYRNRDVWQYLDGVAANSRVMRDDGESRRLVRNLFEIYDMKGINILKSRVDELINYFETQYPGKKDTDYIQKLKGMCREWEADCLWGYFGWNSESIYHLRLGFYQGEIFSEDPTINRDVIPMLKLLKEIRPDIVTLALDPEASGPDTHYKVLQAITGAFKIYERDSGNRNPRILGYRNVWYRFHPSEAELFVPVSMGMFSLQHSAFMNTFISQKAASFPSYEHEGPFSELAQKIQVEQYQMLKTCLGRKYFYEHPSALIRATRGLVFLKSLSLDELYSHTRELSRRTENL